MNGKAGKEFTKGLLNVTMQALTGGATPTPPAAAGPPALPPRHHRHRSRRRHRSRSKRSKKSKRSSSRRRSRSKRSKRSRRQSSSYSDSYSYDDEQEQDGTGYSGHYWQGPELGRDCRKYGDMTEKMCQEVLHILAPKWYLSTYIIYVSPRITHISGSHAIQDHIHFRGTPFQDHTISGSHHFRITPFQDHTISGHTCQDM